MKRLIFVISLTIPLILAADTILDDFQVNTEFPGHPPQKSPYAAARWETETIYVTWLSQRDGVHWDVACNRFNYDLEPLGDAFYLNEPLGVDDCIAPRLALSTAGFGAAWVEDATPNRMMFRSYDDNGNSFCPPVSVAEEITGEVKDSLSIAALTDGYLLVWYDERDDSRIWAQKVNFDGDLIGSNFPIRPDSSGSILGLEAQNHPDGRVLVSWVTDQMYSRGRWLDNTGAFLGDVFEMAEASANGFIVRTKVRIARDSTGILYQYVNWYGEHIYLTYLDSSCIQTGPPIDLGEYYYFIFDDYMMIYFPDFIALSDWEYAKVDLKNSFTAGYGSSTYNRLFSSVPDIQVIPWGVTGDYDLCQINEEDMLYSFSDSYIGLRKYNVSTLDSSDQVLWISEPDFTTPQDNPDLLAQDDGCFRVIYNNWLGSQPQVYMDYFDATGIPAGPAAVASRLDESSPVMTSIGRLDRTGSGDDLIIWPYGGSVFGTTYSHNNWSGEVADFECNPSINYNNPCIDVNSSDHSMLFWVNQYYYEGGTYRKRAYYRGFSQLYSSLNPPILFGMNLGPRPDYSICVRDNGNFIICSTAETGAPDYVVYCHFGINYNELIGYIGSHPISNGYQNCSAPVAEKSLICYWIAWIAQEYSASFHVYLWQLDTDGNPLDELHSIDEAAAEPVCTRPDPALDLAVSDSSGNFAVCWQDARFDEGDIYCRQFNPDGSFYGREYRVNSDPVGPRQCEPAVAFGPNDQLYFTWTDFRNEGGQGDIYCKVIEWEDATAVEPEDEPVPFTFALHKPYPNPFNPSTTITFEIPVAELVKLEVFDIHGRRVGVGLVTNGNAYGAPTRRYEPGQHSTTLDAANLASGIYFVRLQAGEFQQTQKLVLLK